MNVKHLAYFMAIFYKSMEKSSTIFQIFFNAFQLKFVGNNYGICR